MMRDAPIAGTLQKELFASLSARNIAAQLNVAKHHIATTIDRETIYGRMRASCTSLQSRVRIEGCATRGDGGSSRDHRVSSSRFAFCHARIVSRVIDVTQRRCANDNEHADSYEINMTRRISISSIRLRAMIAAGRFPVLRRGKIAVDTIDRHSD